ncbi:MAG TPA: hypothetical protein VGX00_05100 [Thermoplasmata archaeon]|nr:hypothetical protein [Thermoplasmata archaeon]
MRRPVSEKCIGAADALRLGGDAFSLILEPERWHRPELLELVQSQHEGLSQIAAVFQKGLVPFPDPWAGEAAIELLRAVTDLRTALGEEGKDAQLTSLVNLQYDTMIAVSRLVPSTLLRDQAARKKPKNERPS